MDKSQKYNVCEKSKLQKEIYDMMLFMSNVNPYKIILNLSVDISKYKNMSGNNTHTPSGTTLSTDEETEAQHCLNLSNVWAKF